MGEVEAPVNNVINNTYFLQKQPFRSVLLKRSSENLQQIYRRPPMPKYNFNKAAKQSRPEVFCKKGVLENCRKFTRKHLCQSIFI